LRGPEPETRCGFVALIGAPNAGKSTLLNQLVGAKVSIVTPKVQTTRARITGIAIEGTAQIIYVDTPGIFEPKRRLDRAMVTAAWSGVADADAAVLLLDAGRAAKADGIDPDTRRIVDGLKSGGKRPKGAMLLAINKIDLVAKEMLLALTTAANAKSTFEATFMLSALTGDGVADLKAWLAARMPPGPWLYPADQMSDAPLRQLAAEVTREKLFERLHQELPYHSTVETDQWKELRGGAVRIEQTIFVERESQRKIVLGKGGATIKAIGEAARRDIAEIVENKVHLFLFVKVREGWGEDPERYRQMGIEYPKD
jgi:GTP-binding protein Era